MTKTVKLRITLETLRMLERGIEGYALSKYGPCHLLLSDGCSLRVSVVGTDIAPKFECFSLALEADQTPLAPVTSFVIPKDGTVVSILLREEYTEPFTGDPTGLVGRNPITQSAAKPGHVPDHAFASCLVAYGLLIEGPRNRLAIVADWLPFRVEAITDEAQIQQLLIESDVVPAAQYVQQLDFSS